jgi:hypothetical protein
MPKIHPSPKQPALAAAYLRHRRRMVPVSDRPAVPAMYR